VTVRNLDHVDLSATVEMELADTLEAARYGLTRAAVQGQVKIADATYRRIRRACGEAATYIDLDEHAAQIALIVHRSRRTSNAHARSSLDGSSAGVGEEVDSRWDR